MCIKLVFSFLSQVAEGFCDTNPRNTKDRDQTPAQKTKKAGQRKNNHRKNKVTTKQKDACLKHQQHNHQLIDKKHLTN
ncbi:hypothetical protein YC2023_008454 [Brassica napus]